MNKIPIYPIFYLLTRGLYIDIIGEWQENGNYNVVQRLGLRL